MDWQNIIIGPIISEKSMNQANKGKFTFAISKSASKTAIKKAVKNAFKVNVISVQTSVVKGKKKRVGNKRAEITETEWKKAIVMLKKGEKIAIFETGTNNK